MYQNTYAIKYQPIEQGISLYINLYGNGDISEVFSLIYQKPTVYSRLVNYLLFWMVYPNVDKKS